MGGGCGCHVVVMGSCMVVSQNSRREKLALEGC